MTESIATRVEQETAEELQSTANERDSTVSGVAADVLNDWAAEDESAQPGSDGGEFLDDDGDLADDVAELRDDLNMVVSRCRRLTAEQEFLIRNANGVFKSMDWEEYPPLPGNNSRVESRPVEIDELADLDV